MQYKNQKDPRKVSRLPNDVGDRRRVQRPTDDETQQRVDRDLQRREPDPELRRHNGALRPEASEGADKADIGVGDPKDNSDNAFRVLQLAVVRVSGVSDFHFPPSARRHSAAGRRVRIRAFAGPQYRLGAALLLRGRF